MQPTASTVSMPLDGVSARPMRCVEDLENFIRFASVSADPKRAGDVAKCAKWLAGYLRSIGLQRSRVIRTPRHPIVYGERTDDPSRPTLLIYGHYDVQPPDPLTEWKSPPFEPTQRGENLYARGASDDKGQIFCHLTAIRELLQRHGRLPVNVRCLFEGEEEIGSPNLMDFLRRNRNGLRSDTAVISDTRMLGADRPAITYGLRGAVGMEVELRGPATDLHSGTFGGVVHNPIQALCEMITHLHDGNGRIAVPGLYRRVRTVGRAERDYLAKAGPAPDELLHDAGATRAWGETGYSPYERTTIRPALTLNGITGGYQGHGGKAVIPARASAKLSLRLVPDQHPREVAALVRRRLEKLTPKGCKLKVTVSLGATPVLLDCKADSIGAAARAYQRTFGRSPVFLRSGGTIPVVHALREILGTPVVLMGFALPDDRMHAPNEKLHLPTFAKGIRACMEFYRELAARQESRR